LLLGIQIYSQADDLAYDFDFSWIPKVQNRSVGGGVGEETHDAISQAAPAAVVSLTVFEEINGTFALTAPASGLDLPLCIVHNQQGSGRNSGMHAPVLGAYESVPETAHIDAADQGQRQFTPTLHDLAEKKSSAQVDPRVEREREISLAGVFLGKVYGMGPFNMDKPGVGGHGIDGNAIPGEDLIQIEAVYATEGVQPIYGGEGTLVLDIRKAADQDYKLLVSVPLRDQLAGLLDIAEPQVQTFASTPKALAGFLRAMILSLDEACGRVWHVQALSSRIITSRPFVIQQLWRPFVLKVEQPPIGGQSEDCSGGYRSQRSDLWAAVAREAAPSDGR
jgi:hypothetical protein